MTFQSNRFSLPLAAVLLVASMTAGASAQDAMKSDAMAGDAMKGGAMATEAMGVMGMMSEADFELCLEQVDAITFAEVKKVASEACNSMHGSAMGGDAMAPKQ
ncbi:hypothetical protein PSQ90_12065 [Devosia rhodophyticola]|uniref:Pentapeptide MXKDX repeat protein n=1 Tax=Devosia rhodophyticola TaxID=3026423 RepID=A0ABY7YV88_9HYPH|nr:hypothetical protein [Devosia rhodophyticola]WDR05023.1 hypothetical protein PSQ90_12065 [Devosia rhodophyticola]